MSTGAIITISICVTLAFFAVLGFISAKQERELKKIQLMKDEPTILDYLFGGKKNESKNNDD